MPNLPWPPWYNYIEAKPASTPAAHCTGMVISCILCDPASLYTLMLWVVQLTSLITGGIRRCENSLGSGDVRFELSMAAVPWWIPAACARVVSPDVQVGWFVCLCGISRADVGRCDADRRKPYANNLRWARFCYCSLTFLVIPAPASG